jgi:hypothetical protein
MDRRHFLGISGTDGAMLSGGLPLWAIGEKRDGTNYGMGKGPSRLTIKTGQYAYTEWSESDSAVYARMLYDHEGESWERF